MSLVKFPSQIPPARLTVALARVDETIRSPLTNVQQVVSRGNPVWKWTYEYTDLSDSERDVVHAFLMKCRGSVNTFKVTDPGDYEPKGSVSDWIDIFSGYGAFNVVAGSDSNNVNSWFDRGNMVVSHITEDQSLRMETRVNSQDDQLGWRGHSTTPSRINSLDLNAAFIARIKHFAHPDKADHNANVIVGTGTGGGITVMNSNIISSSGVLSVPFVARVDTGYVFVRDNGGGTIGDWWQYNDFRVQRCALIVKSENLLTRSNEFSHADFTKTNIAVESGFNHDPQGGANLWRLRVNSDESNANHNFIQNHTKTNTRDYYVASIKIRAATNSLHAIRLSLEDPSTAGFWTQFDLNSGLHYSSGTIGDFKRGSGRLWDIGSGFYRATVGALVSSHSTLGFKVYALQSSGGGLSFATVDTEYLEISAVQLVKFPFMKPYFETGAAAIVGTGSVAGTSIMLDGLDAEDLIKSGQRLELINKYHNEANSESELSEFKRTTIENKASREGHITLSIDPPIRNLPMESYSVISGDHIGETIHNAVLFHQPEMKGRLLASTIQYTDKPLRATDISFEVLEDMTE